MVICIKDSYFCSIKIHLKMASEQRHCFKDVQEKKTIHFLVYLINSCPSVVCKVITSSRLILIFFFIVEIRQLLLFILFMRHCPPPFLSLRALMSLGSCRRAVVPTLTATLTEN